MAQTKRPSPSARRTPRQQRSVQAVEAIFEATARLIESQGLETLTTARIAELAGYGGSAGETPQDSPQEGHFRVAARPDDHKRLGIASAKIAQFEDEQKCQGSTTKASAPRSRSRHRARSWRPERWRRLVPPLAPRRNGRQLGIFNTVGFALVRASSVALLMASRSSKRSAPQPWPRRRLQGGGHQSCTLMINLKCKGLTALGLRVRSARLFADDTIKHQ